MSDTENAAGKISLLVPQDQTWIIMGRLLDNIREELECRGAEACRYDLLISATGTQRGATLKSGDSDGRVWIREVSETATNDSFCPPMMVDIEVGVIRCHQAVASDGVSLPPLDVVRYEAYRAHQDKLSVVAAVKKLQNRAAVTSWRPYGPQGDAVGSITTVRFTL